MEEESSVAAYDKPVMLFGDGAALCYREFSGELDRVLLASEHLRYQTAIGVASEAKAAEAVTAEALQPLYLRLPQAERELKARQQLQGK